MTQKSYLYGRPWIGVLLPLVVVTLILYALLAGFWGSSGKDTTFVVLGCIAVGGLILSMIAFGVIMVGALGARVSINDEGITYQEPLAKNLRGQKKIIKSRWQDVLEVKEYLGYLGHDAIVKTVNGTFRVTSSIKGYRDLMREVRENASHLRQVPGSKFLHLVKETELGEVRKRSLPVGTKIWIGVVSIMIIMAYIFLARDFYDYLMISLAWFYVSYLVHTKK